MAQKQKEYLVPALEKGIMILNTLSKQELTITQIHSKLNIPKSSTFVILNTLEHFNFIEKTEEGKFRLGPGVFRLGMSFQNNIDIRKTARPYIEKLVADTPYTAHLAVLMNVNPVYIDKVQGNGFVQFSTAIGQSVPLPLSGVGKALACGLEDQEILKSAANFTETATEKGRSALERILEDIQFAREQGFAIEDEEMEDGVRCIGAPIYGAEGKIVASISITSLTKDLPAVKFHTLGQKVKATAQSISKALGYASAQA